MKYIVLISTILLAGCLNDESFGTPDLVTNTGVEVYWFASSKQSLPHAHVIDRWWLEVRQCLSAHVPNVMRTTPPDMLIFGSMDYSCIPGAVGAACWENPPYIATTPSNAHNVYVWKHEMIHWVFALNLLPQYQDHKPDALWNNCAFN